MRPIGNIPEGNGRALAQSAETFYMQFMEIRTARSDDVPEMARMIGELFGVEKDFSSNLERQERGLRAILASDAAAAFVAVVEPGDEIIGMVTVQLTISTAQGGPSGLLEDLFVKEAHRGRGTAARLVEAVELWCSSRGAHRVQLLVDLTNEGAIKFYSARGYLETRMAARRRFIE